VQGDANRPNILFIISDDHAYQQIGVYGSKIAKTPNIDRIAKEGAIFKNSFVTNSICGPSRATLLTGKYSHINGYKANEGKFIDQQTFPKILQQNNYQTAWIGKMHLGSLPKGFDYFNILPGQGQYFNPDFINSNNDTTRINGYVTNVITKLTTDWLDKRDQTKPFCLVVGEKATHRQWMPDIQDLGAFDNVEFPLPPTFNDDYKGRIAAQNQDMTIDKTMLLKEDLKVHIDFKGPLYRRLTGEQRKAYEDYYGKISKEFDQKHLTGESLARWKYQRYMKDYLAVARSLDRNIGEMLDYLDKKGLTKNTVVIYVSDQGFYMGEHGWFDKRWMYEESIRTPFVMRYPGVIKPGTSIEKFALNIDWAPTILSIAGAKVPDDMQGVSLLPLLNSISKNTPWRNEVYYHYYEYPQPHRVSPHFGIRTDKYKLICFYGEKKAWEFFDIQKDPHELNNQYDKNENAKIIVQLKEKLLQLINQYQDKEALQIFEKV
jgi:arylsulfatase A-like enzyme